MTDPLHRLDPSLLFKQIPLPLYRIAHRRFAILAGAGAAAYPGRWNQLGQRAIYTSTEKGTTVLERLVHTQKSVIPSGLLLNEIQLTGGWSRRRRRPLSDLLTSLSFQDEDAAEFLVLPTLQEAERSVEALRTSWSSDRPHPFAIALPSVVLPVWNVVLYPDAPGFSKYVSVVKVEDFQFDPRLFHDDAVPE